MSSTDSPTTTLVYAIEHPREGFPGETSQLAYGTRKATVDDVPALAVEVARRARVEHSYHTGPLTVSVWEAREDEHYRLPVPDNADVYSFPAGQPDNDPA